MGAEPGAKARQPPVPFFIGRPVAQGPFQGEQHRGAAHIAALPQNLPTRGKVEARTGFFYRIKNVMSADVRDHAGDGSAAGFP